MKRLVSLVVDLAYCCARFCKAGTLARRVLDGQECPSYSWLAAEGRVGLSAVQWPFSRTNYHDELGQLRAPGRKPGGPHTGCRIQPRGLRAGRSGLWACRAAVPWAAALLLNLACLAPAFAQTALDQLEKRLDAARPAAEGTKSPSSQPGYLGLFAENATEGAPGVKIVSIKPGGPADKAGFQPGDRILAAGGRVIATTDDLASVLADKSAGDTVPFELSRDGRVRSVQVTLGKRPGAGPEEARGTLPGSVPEPEPVPPVAEPLPERAVLGVSVASVTSEARLRYALTVRRGALIVAVQPGSPAERAGLPVGGVIVAVNGRRVDRPADLLGQMRLARPGQEVEITYYFADRLFRKNVRLAGAPSAPQPARPPAAERPGRLGPLSDELPALRRIEGLIDRFVPPAGGAGANAELAAMKKQIERLQQQVEQLQKRVRQLEARLAGDKTPEPKD